MSGEVGRRRGGKYDQLSCGERFVFIRFIRKVIFPTTLWKKFWIFCSFECIIITVMCWLFFFVLFSCSLPGRLPPPTILLMVSNLTKKLLYKMCPNFFSCHSLPLCHGPLLAFKVDKIRDIKYKEKVFPGITNHVLPDILKSKIQI